MNFTESIATYAAVAHFQAGGYIVLNGQDIAAGERGAERFVTGFKP